MPLLLFASPSSTVTDSTTRSLREYRDAILDELGESSTRRDLAPEPQIPGYTGSSTGTALARLAEVNQSTLSRHFIRPGSAMPDYYYYTVRDRHYKLDENPTVALPDELNGMSGYDLSDETLNNDQFASPSGRSAQVEQSVWTHPDLPISVPAGTTRTYWPSYGNPVLDQRVVSDGTALAVTITPFTTTAKLEVTAGGSDALVTELAVWGRPVTAAAGERVRAENDASITEHGRYARSDINATLLPKASQAQGLADHLVFRFGDPRARPSITLVNRFPDILLAELFEPITLDFARLSLVDHRFEITGMSLDISADNNTWTAGWQLQEAPEQAPVAFFTLDTDTLGSVARLGY